MEKPVIKIPCFGNALVLWFCPNIFSLWPQDKDLGINWVVVAVLDSFTEQSLYACYVK